MRPLAACCLGPARAEVPRPGSGRGRPRAPAPHSTPAGRSPPPRRRSTVIPAPRTGRGGPPRRMQVTALFSSLAAWQARWTSSRRRPADVHARRHILYLPRSAAQRRRCASGLTRPSVTAGVSPAWRRRLPPGSRRLSARTANFTRPTKFYAREFTLRIARNRTLTNIRSGLTQRSFLNKGL